MKALILKDFYVKVGDHDQVIRALVKLPLSSDFFCIPYKKNKQKKNWRKNWNHVPQELSNDMSKDCAIQF